MTQKIIFFGNERIATAVSTTTPTLRSLVEAGYDVCAVIVNNDKSLSRKQRILEVAAYADTQGIPVLSPEKPGDISEQLHDFGAEAAVLVAYGKIIPQSVIDIFPRGIINIHPSLLPLHRGSIPIESVILNGAKETGVSIMSLQKAMDAGPVYRQLSVELYGNETKQNLADSLLTLGARSIIELLPDILSGSTAPLEQNHDAATYDDQITKSKGVIDWSKPAQILEREVRAYAEWPGSTTYLGDVECTITTAGTLDEKVSGEPGSLFIHDKKLAVVCGENALVIEAIKPAGKNEMDSAGFLNGYRSRLEL